MSVCVVNTGSYEQNSMLDRLYSADSRVFVVDLVVDVGRYELMGGGGCHRPSYPTT